MRWPALNLSQRSGMYIADLHKWGLGQGSVLRSMTRQAGLAGTVIKICECISTWCTIELAEDPVLRCGGAGTVISYAQTDVQRMGPVMVKGFATIDNVALINVEGTGVPFVWLPCIPTLHARSFAPVPSKAAAGIQHNYTQQLPCQLVPAHI